MPIPVVAEPISRVPTRETVAVTLRGWIIDGTLAPEEVLRDADIADAFGVSRTPVREALLQLEHEGLVESHPGRWTRVTPLDLEQLDSIFPVWVELEALAARTAAEDPATFTASHQALVERAAGAFAAAVDVAIDAPSDDHLLAVREADERFHDGLLQAAGNDSLTGALIPLRQTVRRFVNTCPRALTVSTELVTDHTRIVAALRVGDVETADAATRAHLRRAYQVLCDGWTMSDNA